MLMELIRMPVMIMIELMVELWVTIMMRNEVMFMVRWNILHVG